MLRFKSSPNAPPTRFVPFVAAIVSLIRRLRAFRSARSRSRDGKPHLQASSLAIAAVVLARWTGVAREETTVYIMYKHGAAEMKTRIRKWGNSLGVRIPKALAQEAALETDSEVDLSSRDGVIVISPTRQKALSLRQLLSGVTEANLHGEIDSGDPKGREAW